MNCPIDGSPLENFSVDEIGVERCPECGGLWFEKEELQQAKEAEGVDLAWLDFDLWSDHEAFETERSSRKCPVCSHNMAAIMYGGTEVKIDYCLKEHGVWLDQGEFENIIDALNNELVSLDLPEYVAVSLDEAKALVSGDQERVHEWEDFRAVIRLMGYKVLADNPRLRAALIELGAHPV